MKISTSIIVIILLVLAACSQSPSTHQNRLPDLRLMTLGGIPGPSLASCPTDKCLTVIVAPWCGVCHSVAPTLVQFRRYLDARSVSSRIVVSLSEPGPIRKFAQEFGSDTLLDDGQQMTARSVPQLLVSDRSGRIVKSVSGFPRISTLDELASYLNLP